MIRLATAFMLSSLILVPPCHADPDFYILFDSCKTVAGALYPAEKSIIVTEGDPVLFSCTRSSNSIRCEVKFKGTEESVKETPVRYEVKMEIAPFLIFTDDNHSDYIVANPSQHGAVVITRLVGENFAGSKVCQGTYMTASEKKALEQKK